MSYLTDGRRSHDPPDDGPYICDECGERDDGDALVDGQATLCGACAVCCECGERAVALEPFVWCAACRDQSGWA